MFLGSNPIVWSSRKQTIVALSTTEVKYRSVTSTVFEVMWIRALLEELGVQLSHILVIWCDNSNAISLSSNLVLHSQSKHIELQLHFVRELVAANKLKRNYVPSSEQIVDILTKPLATSSFSYFKTKMNVCASSEFQKEVAE